MFRVLDRGAGLCEPIDVSSGDLRPYLGPEFEHKLKGDKRDFWSVDVNGAWRIHFRFKDGDAHDLHILDPH